MLHFLHLLRALLYTVVIIGTPTLIATGGHVPSWLWGHPAFQFATLFVFAYAAAPVISDYLGHHAGTALFFPNRPNLGHPTISHIVSLLNKRLYKEALEELRMLTEIDSTDFRAYKMLLNISAMHIPDRGMFDMFYRKGMQSLQLEEETDLLTRYRNELIELKAAKGEDWSSSEPIQEEIHTRHFYVNRKHHRQKAKTLVDSHSATLPPREQRAAKTIAVPVVREEKSVQKKAIVPHHFHPAPEHVHHAPMIPEVHTVLLEKSGENVGLNPDVIHEMDSAIEHFVEEKKEEPKKFRFIRPRLG